MGDWSIRNLVGHVLVEALDLPPRNLGLHARVYTTF